MSETLKPDFSKAFVGRAKTRDYLLAPKHAKGKSKAKFFLNAGFDGERWEQMERALIAHAQAHPVARVSRGAFGVKYTIDGELVTPSGKRARVRTVWMIPDTTLQLRFVTSYPL